MGNKWFTGGVVATFQREDIRLQASTVTHLRLTVTPNKSGTRKATLVSLMLYS